MCACMHTYIHTYMVMSQRIYWISQKCFHCYGVVGFKRPYFKILTESQPISYEKMGFSKADKKYFPEIACSEQQTVGLSQVSSWTEPSHPIEWTQRGWNGVGKIRAFPSAGTASFRERKGMGGDYQGLQPIWRKSHLELLGQTGLRLELIAMNPWRRED